MNFDKKNNIAFTIVACGDKRGAMGAWAGLCWITIAFIKLNAERHVHFVFCRLVRILGIMGMIKRTDGGALSLPVTSPSLRDNLATRVSCSRVIE